MTYISVCRTTHRYHATLVLLSLLIAAQASTGCLHGPVTSSLSHKVAIVPMIRLLATPERYDSRKVTTVGVIMIGVEESNLYLSRDEANVGVPINKVDLIFSGPITRESAAALSGKYVAVEGRFDVSEDPALFESPAGSISEISDLVDIDSMRVDNR